MLSFVGSQLTSQIDDIGEQGHRRHRPDPPLAQHDVRHHRHPARGLHRPGPRVAQLGHPHRHGDLGGPHGDAHRGRLLHRDVRPVLLPLRRPGHLGLGGAALPAGGAREGALLRPDRLGPAARPSPARRWSSPPWMPPASASAPRSSACPSPPASRCWSSSAPSSRSSVRPSRAPSRCCWPSSRSGPVQALIMLGIVIGVQQVEAHLLQPLLVGRVMRIHPLAVILAIAAGVILAGIIGGLIAVPTVAVLNAVGHHLLDGPESRGRRAAGQGQDRRGGARARARRPRPRPRRRTSRSAPRPPPTRDRAHRLSGRACAHGSHAARDAVPRRRVRGRRRSTRCPSVAHRSRRRWSQDARAHEALRA